MDGALPPAALLPPRDLEYLIAWKSYFAATLTLLLWDWVISLDDEVARIWQRRKNAFTALWVLIRYLPIIMFLSAAYTLFQTTWSQERCRALATLPTAFVIAVVIIAHAVFLLRTFALYGRSIRLLAVLVPMLAAEAAVLVYTAFGETTTDLPVGLGCLPGSPRRLQGVLTWAAPFVFDCTIFALTLHKTLHFLREHTDAPVVAVLLRDGIAYFMVMMFAYLLNMLLYLFAPQAVQDINAGFSVTITVVMTCRLILNLRAVAHGAEGGGESYLPTMRSRLRFGRPRAFVETLVHEIGGAADDAALARALELEERAFKAAHAPASSYATDDETAGRRSDA